MRFVLPLMLVCLVAGCNTPAPAFRDVPARRVTIGPSTFDVRVKGDRAYAIRTNMEYAPNFRFTAVRFKAAFEAASGCKVGAEAMRGDQAVMEARLTCAGKPPRPWKPDLRLTCDIDGRGPDLDDRFLTCTEVYQRAIP